MKTLELRSPTIGSVWKIEVAKSAKVKSDDVIMVLQAMKMEIPVSATRDGTVAEILVQEGQEVDEDQVVAILTIAGDAE